MFDFVVDPGFQTEERKCNNQIYHHSDPARQGKSQQMGRTEYGRYIQKEYDGPDDDMGDGVKLTGEHFVQEKVLFIIVGHLSFLLQKVQFEGFVQFVGAIAAVFTPLLDAFRQQILNLTVNGTEIVFGPGGDGIVKLGG